MRSLALVPLTLLFLWASAAPASAQTDDELAREHFRAGRAYFERAQYGEAAEEFEESYALSQRPALLLNVSRAYELDGRLPEAIEAIDRYLATEEAASDAEARAGAEARRGRLAAEQSRQEEERAEAEANPPMPPLQLAGLATLGGAGALAIGAVVTGVLALKRHEDLEAACPGGVCPPDEADTLQRGERLAHTSTTLSIVGGAAAVTGLLLYFLGDREAPEAGEAQVEVTGGPRGIQGGVRVVF